MLHDLQAPAFTAEDGRVVDVHIVERDVAVVGRHVERPQHFFDLEAVGVGRHDKGGDAVAVARLAAGAGKDQIVFCLVDSGVPGLLASDSPAVAVANGGGFHMGGIGAMSRLGDAEGEPLLALQHAFEPLVLLLVRAVVEHQESAHVVPHNRVLVL